MPPRRAKETGLPAVDSPVLLDYFEQLAILLLGQLMKWLRPLLRRGDSIPLADLKDALGGEGSLGTAPRHCSGIRPAAPHRGTCRGTRRAHRRIRSADRCARPLRGRQGRLQAHLAQQREIAEAEDQQQPLPPAVMSAAEIAEVDGVTRSFVNRLLRLTLLAPDILEAILDGKQPKGMQLEELTGTVPSGWEGQRASVGVRPAAFVGATLVRSLEA